MPKFGKGKVSRICNEVMKFLRLSDSALTTEYRPLRSSAKSTLVFESTLEVTSASLLREAKASTMLARFLFRTRSASGNVSRARPRLSLSRARATENRFSPSTASMMSWTCRLSPDVNSASRGIKSTNWSCRPATAW